MREMDIDKKINKLRLEILNLETQLIGMLYPKDEMGEGFLPEGNEIPFNFKKTRYESMMDNIRYSINDLNNIKRLSEEIYKIK